VDYAAASGTPIMATSDGVVTHRGPLGGLGNAVVIEHPNGFRTRYGHMSSFANDVRVGTRVRQSQVIGFVGATGLATAPHLHYELWRSGRAVDPLAIDLPSGDPVPDDDWSRWAAEMQVRLALLERLPAPGDPRYAEAASDVAVLQDGDLEE
jgi:murein DD-endopeptidase MepM/ murein hydrolase activator NlpD